MRGLLFDPSTEPLRVLLLGAHADDIEIGCFGAVDLLRRNPMAVEVLWVVFSAAEARASEARASAEALLSRGFDGATIHVGDLPDAYFPARWADAKRWLDEVAGDFEPDLLFTHHRDDRHQDHRVVSELTWNRFRDAMILEYEVPKYDGELGQPNTFVAMEDEVMTRKTRHLIEFFPSQATRPWFTESTFRALARLRGVESGVESGHAEAFHVRKMRLVG